MPKPFAALDVDGTLFKSSLLEKVVDESVKQHLFSADPFNEAYNNRRRWQDDNNEGRYTAYLRRLIDAFYLEIAGVKVEKLDEVVHQVVEEQRVRRFSFPRMVIGNLRPTHEIIAISGSPEILVEPFLHDLDVGRVFGSHLVTVDGEYTGEAAPVGDKKDRLKELVATGYVSQMGSVALGDTISDVSMLHYSANPIMFNASHTLTEYGKEFGWARINEVKDQVTLLCKDSSDGQYKEKSPTEYLEKLRQLS